MAVAVSKGFHSYSSRVDRIRTFFLQIMGSVVEPAFLETTSK